MAQHQLSEMNFVEFPLGPFIFSTGGILFFVGILAAAWMLIRTTHEKGLSLAFLNEHLLLFGVSAVVIGRLGVMGKLWSYFHATVADESIFVQLWIFLKKFIVFWQGGIDTFWTGVAFLVVFLIMAFDKRQHPWKWLDVFVLPTILLLVFWGVGAFFSAWDYGRPAPEGFWFGVTYNVQEVRYAVPLHPVQLYGALAYSILFLWGWRLWRKGLVQKDGTFFGIMTLAVFFINGILEFFRGDPVTTVTLGGLDVRLPQLASFVLVLVMAFFLIFYTHPQFLHHERKLPPHE